MTHEQAISVAIVSDLRLYREGLHDVLGRARECEVVGAVASAAEALALVREREPRVTLLDLSMPGSTDLVATLARESPSRIVVLTVGHGDALVITCAEAGVAGYVTRDDGLSDLIETIVSVDRDEMRCSPRIAATLLRRVAAMADGSSCERPNPQTQLTTRESEILTLIEKGLSNKEIAAALCIEVTTVKNHVHHILDKLGARRRSEAAAIARGARPQIRSSA